MVTSGKYGFPLAVALGAALVSGAVTTSGDAAGKTPRETAHKSAAKTAVAEKKHKKLPKLHHRPVSTAVAHEPLVIEAKIDDPDRVAQALLVYQSPGRRAFREVPFRRAGEGYVAEIPAERVEAPAIAYTIEVVGSDGARRTVFASRSRPQRVLVPEDGMDQIEAAQAARVGDRRSVFSSRGEWVSFGQSVATVDGAEMSVDDSYYRIEGGYTYRPLRAVSEFSIRVGVVRGKAPVAQRDLLPGQSEDERFDVGLNYGAPSVRFRLGELWHIDGGFLANVTEVGFSVGTLGTLHIGDIRGTKVSLGFEAIQTFGWRFFTQLDLVAHERVILSPIIEVTNMPSADDFGVRLLGEINVDIGWGFAAVGRGGYQARDFTSGGPSAGGGLSYAF